MSRKYEYEYDYEYDYDNDDDCENEDIKDVAQYIISNYELNKNNIDKIRSHLINIIKNYNIERRVDDYREQLMDIYLTTVHDFLEYDCPLDIFDNNRYCLSNNFINWAYNNTEYGIELEYINKIYNKLININK